MVRVCATTCHSQTGLAVPSHHRPHLSQPALILPICAYKCGEGKNSQVKGKTQTTTFAKCQLADTHYAQLEMKESGDRGGQSPLLLSGEAAGLPANWKERRAQCSLKVEKIMPLWAGCRGRENFPEEHTSSFEANSLCGCMNGG